MTRLGRTKKVDPTEAEKYRTVAESLIETAGVLDDLSSAGDRYGNGMAVIVIHAAIAWTDALTVAYGGVKSTDGDHTRAADLLRETLGDKAPAKELRTLQRIIASKDIASYTGTYFTLPQAAKLLKDLLTFSEWARGLYESRPPARKRR